MWIWTTLLAVGAAALSPAPKEIRVNDGDHFFFRADALVVLPDNLVSAQESLLDPLADFWDGSPQVIPASRLDKLSSALYIATVAHPGALDKRKLRRYLKSDKPLSPSGFRLTVGKNGVVLVGADVQGVWYGLHALAGLLNAYDANLPYLEMSDWPSLAVRGVYLRGLPTALELRRFSALRATHLFIESDDFYDLTGVRAEAWRRAFDEVRSFHMEPVPVFSTLDGMAKVLRDYPMLIEGRGVTEAITLHGVDSEELRYPNIIAQRPEDITVHISGVPCTVGEDYWLEGPAIQAPFQSGRPRWQIWRELEGAIPDGGTVTVSYSYATADSSSLAFADPGAKRWLTKRLERLITTLRPRYIHLDHGGIGRLNTDIRSRNAGLSDAARFVQSLTLLTAVIEGVDSKIGLMMWADLLNPAQSASIYGLAEVADSVPSRIQRVGRVHPESHREVQARLKQFQTIVERPMLLGVDGSPGMVQAVVQGLARNGSAEGGIIALSEDEERVAAALAAAWRGPDGGGIWMRLLNGYFNTDLETPDYGTVQAALVGYLNKKTLNGQSPEAVYDAYEDFAGRNRSLLAEDEEGADIVTTVLSHLTTYLALEERYSTEGDDGALRKLHKLVEAIQERDPSASDERYQRILDTIAEQRLFVPASILFQADLRYFRPGTPQHPLYAVPVQPTYEDAQGQIAATVNLMTGQAPVRRIDFEGLGVKALTVSISGDGRVYEGLQTWRGEGDQGQVRGPLLLSRATRTKGLRLTAIGERSPLVLRDVRIFGEKLPPVMTAHYAVQAPTMVAKFTGRSWARQPQGHSFLQQDSERFAEAPTAVWVTHTREALYVGIMASETRPDAIVADFVTRDAPLWEQESVEIWLHPKGRLPLRLIVNPLGTQYDSEAFDSGWDGDWSAVAERTDQGWSAIVRIPAKLVGDVKRGGSIPMNVVRNRLGVRKERSAWAHDYGAQPDLQWGALRFP